MTEELTKLIVPNGQYDGFWGVNGYDNIMLLARPWNEDKWYILSTEADVFNVYELRKHPTALSFNLDIPTKYGVPRIWFNYPVDITYEIPTANIMGHFTEREDPNVKTQ